jgi:secreted PhoX family phosphatase
MDDGLIVPGKQDAMAAFPRPDGLTALVINHEVEIPAHGPLGAFGPKDERLDRLTPDAHYDRGARARGGCSTIVYDTRTGEVRRKTLTLAGTVRNCAGGATPWNTWLTCEECFDSKGNGFEQDHGYVFECEPLKDGCAVRPRPIRDMGRFNHEAVAVDPASGVVYLTEDRSDGLLYRYVPRDRADLHKGGKLQALAIKGRKGCSTRNWEDSEPISVGTILHVEWIDLDVVDTPVDDLRYRGFSRGAARFARGEGMWYGIGPGARKDSPRSTARIYFACTNGGMSRRGQLWRYLPSPYEGTDREREDVGLLELFLESADSTAIHNADNLSVTPWGGLVVCEDCDHEEQRLLVVSPQGELSTFARNALNASELAGSCFSPDGSTMFVNIQNPGITIAVRGPWA